MAAKHALDVMTGNLAYSEWVASYQAMIDDGSAWQLEGSIGREAMRLIEEGICMLGEDEHYDYYGNHIPSRTQVQPGTKGSPEYVAERGGIPA